MKAKVHFDKSRNGDTGYSVSILCGDKWMVESWFPLIERKDHSFGRKDCLSFKLLHKLAELREKGYEIDIKL